eukprot:TRINITY_DN64396_c0_g1_i1.p1 TRINITY_DN64396_c0_g1~~TRINITY_DN64396_c0_g1_i1.p1  ORF type:complete len:835 (+),score=64.35 TRINITY_DN64396_c0_g1_i1:219-2507(+)
MVAGYDFAGSSSAKECSSYAPDNHSETWASQEGIRSTQWARNWTGLVRGTMREMLFMSTPFSGDKVKGKSGQRDRESFFPPMSRAIFVFSITGGPITQMERTMIPDLISGVLADFSRLDIKDFDHLNIIWVHFETVFDLFRALAGYGTIDLDAYIRGGRHLWQSCEWTDGSTWDQEACLFQVCDFDGIEPESPEMLFDWLILDKNIPAELDALHVPLGTKLIKAVKSGDPLAVQTFLERKADPNSVDVSDVSLNYQAIHWAVGLIGNVEMIKILLDAKANPSARALDNSTPADLVRKELLYQLDQAKNVGLYDQVLKLLSDAGAEDVEGAQIPVTVSNDGYAAMPLGLAIREGKCSCAFISSPASGPRQGSLGSPFDFKVMPVLERLVYMFADTPHKMLAGYDFAGSASAEECSIHTPDQVTQTWESFDGIKSTQWARYWSGLVRGTMRNMLFMAPPIEGDAEPAIAQDGQRGLQSFFPPKSRAIFVFSITGGPITQMEYTMIPGLMTGVLSNLAHLDVRDYENLNIIWIHFDTVFDLFRALSGYGTIDLESYLRGGRALGQPCKWTDGSTWSEEGCIFQVCNFKGYEPNSPETLFNWIVHQKNLPVPVSALTVPIDTKLIKAIKSGDSFVVNALLEEKASPNAVDSSDTVYGYNALHWAVAMVGNVDIISLLLDKKADPNARTKGFGLVASFGLASSGATPLDLVKRERLYTFLEAKNRNLFAKVTALLTTAGAMELPPEPSPLAKLCACFMKPKQVADKE